ncbi:aspartate aminotransferase family protein [Clostridium sp. A1-XYC3]|uniref:Acetylornithine aminotransferase n=1 Tax=Clostridium tanneri TaxID=3037988 RepID=A0ABU4JWL0_9CLOT|nr:aspartate aminotransferase family protein [Clostridium sp. A1-XYC3]MDW8802518.1 aspartate aminotransferase family protein [Clostridium sp. A1-XYC3]
MEKNNLMNTYGRFDVIFEKGIGTKIYDTNGVEYLDFVSGVAVNCLGHSHPIMVKALSEQSKKIIHVSNYYWNTEHIKLSEKLIEHCDHNKVFFCNSGTEAIEGALKLARKYGKSQNTNKDIILYMDNSFHGRTMGALSVTGQEKYQQDFLPLIPRVKKINFNDIEDLYENFTNEVCGIIIEPIQGEGGINAASTEYLKEARKLCDKFNALLIFDEIQCGMGRIGNLFAYKQFDVIPDVIPIAKALGGGFPIGAVIANEKAAKAFVPGDHGSTFGGNPLGCAVALAVITELTDGGVINSVQEKGSYLKEKLNGLKNKYSLIDEVKGMGLLLGISINTSPKEFTNLCFRKGLLVVTAGTDVIRLLPPLNVTVEEIDTAVKILEEAIKELS